MAQLVLVRHGLTEWNKQGLWTGLTDVDLAEEGKEEARKAGEHLKDIPFQYIYTSELHRTIQTLEEITKVVPGLASVPTQHMAALNERDYGDLTGKNKWKIKEEYGEEQFMAWRRGWDTPPPHGESLHDVYNRVVPFYTNEIEPKLKEGKNVLIISSGNELRGFIKYLEHLSEDQIVTTEIKTGEVWVYTINPDGTVAGKDIRVTNTTPGNQ